ncbi:MAGUK p55 subfamily member 7 isoform X3 [Folsomia candida]|uniref:MAGUK p55 subfamily member 7 isoform X3 n=1 Tax=Folsomia candida TaxID=158441 RepID=UPI000B8FB7B6|nr:MAGUK p55 subfamily member 7 isoform X3 [Folsomia candida]
MLDNSRWDPVLSKLLVSLEESRRSLPTGCEEEVSFLSDLLQSRELHALVKVHNSIEPLQKDDRFFPLLSNVVEVTEEVLGILAREVSNSEENPEAAEVFELLQNPHIQGLLYSHDIIAQKDYLPKLPEIPTEVLQEDEEEETIKIVQLVKSSEPLDGARTAEPIVGATIRKDDETGKILIARVMHGGAAHRSGLIFPGDEVIEVNGLTTEGKTPDDVLQILKQSEGTITFKLVPCDSGRLKRESKVRVRCLFDYQSKDDPHIPCEDAGLDFKKGDVLHIVSQDDVYWWQARREGDRTMRAGLIPSRSLQEKRILMVRTNNPEAYEHDDYDREDIPTYEEVAKLYPRPGHHRPIVLVGPPGVGRNELKRRLTDLDNNKYNTTIPFTSRPQRPGETNGKDYCFVTREKMEEDIQSGRFIEFGEYKGNLYGTACETVRSVINAGQVCVLNPHSQALKMLRTPEFKPYIIYVKPPPEFEVLKQSRHNYNAKSTFDESNSRAFNDDEFHEILKSAQKIEFHYGHWFDETLINDDLPKAFERLVKIVKKVENESLWVPASWVQ